MFCKPTAHGQVPVAWFPTSGFMPELRLLFAVPAFPPISSPVGVFQARLPPRRLQGTSAGPGAACRGRDGCPHPGNSQMGPSSVSMESVLCYKPLPSGPRFPREMASSHWGVVPGEVWPQEERGSLLFDHHCGIRGDRLLCYETGGSSRNVIEKGVE